MGETVTELENRLRAAVVPGFRERLLDRGLARGFVWRDGVLPPDSPPFADSLTDDLLDYGHSVLAVALRLRTQTPTSGVLQRAFVVAGEAIEAAVHRGDLTRDDRAFNRVTAAVAFHLGRFAARAYSLLPNAVERENAAPTEAALIHLLRRNLDEMHAYAKSWLLADENQDAHVAYRFAQDPDFDEEDVFQLVLTTSFMRGLALFGHSITTGDKTTAHEAKRRLVVTADAAKDFNAVTLWWIATLASHLLDDLWGVSLHELIPHVASEGEDDTRWRSLREKYIHRLRCARRSAIELWPSQFEAAQRAVDTTDDLVVALPTSAGKTRIAELCILRAFASGKRVVYVTPLRALSAQIERDLAETFTPLGFTVSSLYGAAGLEYSDSETLRTGNLVVSTPEKLDFALRNDPTILNDVGLVVLDEGHMLGPSEREVRYEALVQRLIRRPDSAFRRIICLSALFPSADEMADLVSWIRQDEPGTPVHSVWRPTRQRFGTLQWIGNGARLDAKVEEESPYIRRFVETVAPPPGSRRRNPFPQNKNELTLAAAWRFIDQEKKVLVYCSLRVSVETLGKLVLKCLRQGVLQPLRELNTRIRNAMSTGAEWLGADHPAVECLQYGVALHHGGLPRPFLNEVERLLRMEDCPLTIASPTLAQGLNLSASVLLVPSIWRNQDIIPAAEFANVAGRAGRAFVDVEGLVLHVIWEEQPRRRRLAEKDWNALVARAKAPKVESGLLALCVIIFERISEAAGVPLEEVVDYITGHDHAWEFSHYVAGNVDVSASVWERDIASLDAAILALLDAETDEPLIADELRTLLEGSLFSKQLARWDREDQEMITALLSARARRIWTKTTAARRKGFHVAGVGLRAGLYLDANISNLIGLLWRAEQTISQEDVAAAAEAIIAFARIVFQTEPFGTDSLSDSWEEALWAWMSEETASEVIHIGGADGVDLLQDAFAYRLPWAMEAVRVHGMAVGEEIAGLLRGFAAMAVEAGSTRGPVITLLRSGLSSREAAVAAVDSTGASFNNRSGMLAWVSSPEVKRLRDSEDWPTRQSRHAWTDFVEGERRRTRRPWVHETQRVPVTWEGQAPPSGFDVVLVSFDGRQGGRVLTPDMVTLGHFETELLKPYKFIVTSRVAGDTDDVSVIFFAPPI